MFWAMADDDNRTDPRSASSVSRARRIVNPTHRSAKPPAHPMANISHVSWGGCFLSDEIQRRRVWRRV